MFLSEKINLDEKYKFIYWITVIILVLNYLQHISSASAFILKVSRDRDRRTSPKSFNFQIIKTDFNKTFVAAVC